MKKFYYFAASTFEGCGHRHRTVTAARRCLSAIEKRANVGVYKQHSYDARGGRTLVWVKRKR